MRAEVTSERMTVEEYLAAELESDVRHEFHGGVLIPMPGESVDHNRIAGNLYVALHAHLRGTPCNVFINGVKVHVDIRVKELFYYPDVFVACEPSDNDPLFRRGPRLIIEVLSPASESKDEVEKYFAYQYIPALQEYLIVNSDPRRPETRLFRRQAQWLLQEGDIAGAGGEVYLRSIDWRLPLAQVYDLA